jgi:phytoene dehydrogenase-like protein
VTRVVVVGSGMAGLTAAAYLARDGCDVDVFEQADHIGGVTATLRKEGFAAEPEAALSKLDLGNYGICVAGC